MTPADCAQHDGLRCEVRCDVGDYSCEQIAANYQPSAWENAAVVLIVIAALWWWVRADARRRKARSG